MKEMILFRGISVERNQAENIKESMIENGISGDEGFWHFELNNLHNRLEELINKPDLTTEDTRPSIWINNNRGGSYRKLIDAFPVICAADELGAHYYALVHNKHKNKDEVGLIVSFKSDIDVVFVDGRDFLYPCFQFWDQNTTEYYAKQLDLLVNIYGTSIKKYFEKASKSKKQNYRIAMCDLATQDIEVVKAHYKNNIVIGGRYGTVFKAAFFVKAPITPEKILSVKIVEQSPYSFTPDIRLHDFIEGRI